MSRWGEGEGRPRDLVEELETLRDIHVSERQIAEGNTISNDDARHEILEFVKGRIDG